MIAPRENTRGAPRLWLASRSPRRRELLARAGAVFECVDPGVDDAELAPGRVTPAQWAAALAYLKARAGAESVPGSSDAFTVLGADTICVLGGAIIGQPRDADDARRMLRMFQGVEHDVVTGVALVEMAGPPGERAVAARSLFVDRARVRMGTPGGDRIEVYLASGAWRGKAGAYNLAERLDDGWPITYDGDAGTIMGLPLRALRGRLGTRAEPSGASA